MGSRAFVVISAIIFSLFTTAPTAQQAAKGGVNSQECLAPFCNQRSETFGQKFTERFAKAALD